MIACEDCCLSDYILYQKEYGEDGLPDYAKSHFYIFDDIDLKKGDRVSIYTCHGEDHQEIGEKTGKHYDVLYWNLDAPIWKDHSKEVKLMRAGDGMSVFFK